MLASCSELHVNIFSHAIKWMQTSIKFSLCKVQCMTNWREIMLQLFTFPCWESSEKFDWVYAYQGPNSLNE